MLQETVKELLVVLEREIELYQELLQISKEKTEVIIKGKVNELDAMVKAEQKLIQCLSGLEDNRGDSIKKMASFLNLELIDVTIGSIVNRINIEDSTKLKSLQSMFLSLINELKQINDMNSKLVKNSIDFIDFSLNMITEPVPVGNTYGYNGQVSDGSKRNFFDRKL